VAQGEEVGALVIVDALASAPAGWSGAIDEALLLQGFAVEQGVVLDPERPQALFEGEGGTSLRGLFEVYSRHVRLMLEHTPTPYPGALLLLHAAGSPSGDDGAMGWSRLALRGCTVRELSGTHHGVLHAPHVASLAREIAAWLRQASQAGDARAVAPERRERS
jgi:thioesterase domain-containing protein